MRHSDEQFAERVGQCLTTAIEKRDLAQVMEWEEHLTRWGKKPQGRKVTNAVLLATLRGLI